MGKVFDANGNKMNFSQVCTYLKHNLTDEHLRVLGNHMPKEGTPHARFAHAVLDSYKYAESTSDAGVEVRKALDYMLTKYQKSSQPLNVVDSDDVKELISMCQQNVGSHIEESNSPSEDGENTAE